MKRRNTILVILAKPEDWWLVPMLESLAQDMPMKIASLVPSVHHSFSHLKIDLFLYQEDERMSGYLPGLDQLLDNVGLIVTTDNYSVCSFQACRLASKFSIPFIVFYSGVQFQYGEGRPNVRAMKYDINTHAQKFIAFSERSKQILIDEAVPLNKIVLMSPSTSCVPFLGNSMKFKKYFGFDHSRDLIVYHDILEPQRHNEAVLQAAKISMDQRTGLRSPIWVIVGNGSQAAKLKWDASQLGLRGTVFFLEQDSRPFINDMLCAADFYIPSLVEDHDKLVPSLGFAQQAYVEGAEVVLSKDGFHGEILQDVKIRLLGKRPENILACLSTLNTLRQVDGSNKKTRDLIIVESETARHALKVFLQSHVQMEALVNNFENAVTEVEKLISHGQYLDMFTAVDDLLLKHGLSDRDKAQAWRLRGDCHVAVGDYSEATNAYEQAIVLDVKCTDAYTGLGMISLRSKASDEAITFLGKAYAIDPSKQKVAIGMANACADGGLLNEATWWIEKALGMSGSDLSLANAVIRIASFFPDRKAATKFLERVYETMGDHPSLMMGLGKAYLDDGKYELGNKLIREALGKTAS